MDTELSTSFADSVGIAMPDIAALRCITTEALLQLGMRQIAYLKPGLHVAEPAFTLVAADGIPVIALETSEGAARAAMYLNLELLTIH
jgi:hypothetical protein